MTKAHNIERVAEDHFGIDISNGSVKFLLDGLYNPRTHKGLLVYAQGGKLTNLVVEAGEAAKDFFKRVRNWYEQNEKQGNGKCYKNFVEDNVSGHFKELRAGLGALAKQTKDEDERFELMRYVDKCTALLLGLEAFLQQTKEDYVYWVEVSEGRRAEAVSLQSAPLNVGPDLKRCLFDKFESVVMTSATLSSGEDAERKGPLRLGYASRAEGRGKRGFEIRGRVGLSAFGETFLARRRGEAWEDYEATKVGSPFDYQKQVTLYIEKDLPEPNSEVCRSGLRGDKEIHPANKRQGFCAFYELSDAHGVCRAGEGMACRQRI